MTAWGCREVTGVLEFSVLGVCTLHSTGQLHPQYLLTLTYPLAGAVAGQAASDVTVLRVAMNLLQGSVGLQHM